MVSEQTKGRARELRRAGVSLREIAKVIGVSHVSILEWTRDEPVGKTMTTSAPAPPAGVKAPTMDSRARLDALISNWSERADSDRNAAALVERLLRQREKLDAQDEVRRDSCATHLEAVEVLAWFANLSFSSGSKSVGTSGRASGLDAPERLRAVDHLLNECEARIAGLFNHTGEYLPGHANYERAAQASVESLEEEIESQRAATETSIEEDDSGST